MLAAMRSCRFFETLDQETIGLLRATARRVNQPRNTVVFHAGEPCNGLYIVEHGAVKLYRESADAREHVLFIATAGDAFGEAALFLGEGYPASAMTIKDSSLILLRKDEFLALLREKPEICFSMMAAMAEWSHRLVSSIEALTLKDASARFADYILSKMQAGQGGGAVIDLGMPKQVLASHLGMTGETLSRLIARFEEDELIATQGRSVKILSVDDLTDLAEYGSA